MKVTPLFRLRELFLNIGLWTICVFLAGFSVAIIYNSNTLDLPQPNINFIQAPHAEVDYLILSNSICVNGVTTQQLFGSSMRPTAFTGNTLLLKEYNKTTDVLKEGMIIIYDSGNSKVAHRIEALYNNKLALQGDNNYYSEEIYYENITDIVVGVLFT